MPGRPFDSRVIESFRHLVHFFVTRQAGEQRAAGHPGTFLLTLGEAANLAARRTSGCSQSPLGHTDGRVRAVSLPYGSAFGYRTPGRGGNASSAEPAPQPALQAEAFQRDEVSLAVGDPGGKSR